MSYEAHKIDIHQAHQSLLAAIDEAGCELEWLASLMELLIEQLEQMHERVSPVQSAAAAANVGRIARDWVAQLSAKMIDAEERCAIITSSLQRS